jgi:hypothetical protein
MQSIATDIHCPDCRAILRQAGQEWTCPACHGTFRCPCPSCEGWLRLSTSLGPSGPAQDWVCTDSTCPTVLSADQARALSVRDDVLGAPIEALMRAPVTPQGGGGGNGRSRREAKPGDREAIRARRERRYLDQEPAGGRDRDADALGCDRLTSCNITVRLSRVDAGRVRSLARHYGSVVDVWREALDIMEALCGHKISRPLDGDPPDMV